jgi:hypothetical protein
LLPNQPTSYQTTAENYAANSYNFPIKRHYIFNTQSGQKLLLLIKQAVQKQGGVVVNVFLNPAAMQFTEVQAETINDAFANAAHTQTVLIFNNAEAMATNSAAVFHLRTILDTRPDDYLSIIFVANKESIHTIFHDASAPFYNCASLLG